MSPRQTRRRPHASLTETGPPEKRRRSQRRRRAGDGARVRSRERVSAPGLQQSRHVPSSLSSLKTMRGWRALVRVPVNSLVGARSNARRGFSLPRGRGFSARVVFPADCLAGITGALSPTPFPDAGPDIGVRRHGARAMRADGRNADGPATGRPEARGANPFPVRFHPHRRSVTGDSRRRRFPLRDRDAS